MAIIYWNNHGRLGNLLFQYAAIVRYTEPDDRIYSFHNEVFDLVDVDSRLSMIPGAGMLAHRIKLRANKVALSAVRCGILGLLEPETTIILDRHKGELPGLSKDIGRVRNCFVMQGYHQDGSLRDVPIRLKPAWIARARGGIDSIRRSAVTVAVHIRLTDYAEWSVLGAKGALIDPKWYLERMNELRKRLDSPIFVIFSDDIASARTQLYGADVVYFQGGSALEDFAALSVCDHAIISPSSFAWWSAVIGQIAGKIIMAPQFWAGFKTQTWYPPSIVTPGFEYYRAL